MSGDALAAAAISLLGVPFRLGGRDPATGLDCIGVLDAALRRCGRAATLPSGYPLRTRRLPDLDGWSLRAGLDNCSGPVRAGHVLLVRCSAVQPHLLIAAGNDRFVHAHAGLRKVVLGARDAGWPTLAHWHLAAERD